MSQQLVLFQRTPEWMKERSLRIGGSEIGALVGLSSYKSPKAAINEKIAGILRVEAEHKPLDQYTSSSSSMPSRMQENMEHGNRFEMAAFYEFLKWFTNYHKTQVQQYTIPPMYHIPDKLANEIFTDPKDPERFGVSLDVEASVIDVEIKNPVSHDSFMRNYFFSVNPMYYAQVQYAMAIRQRKEMFFMATCFDKHTEELLDIVIWYVKFDLAFFMKYLYGPARRASDLVMKRIPLENELTAYLPWINQSKQFESSEFWKEQLKSTCKRVYAPRLMEKSLQDDSASQ